LNLWTSYLQYYSDANEAESWMKEKEPLVTSDDYGRDEASAKVHARIWSATNLTIRIHM